MADFDRFQSAHLKRKKAFAKNALFFIPKMMKEQVIPQLPKSFNLGDLPCFNISNAPPKVEYKTFESSTGFISALERRGFKCLGRGYFSVVLGKEGSDRVIKVSTPRDRPEGWVPYVLWGHAQGYAGTFSPKLYSFKWITPWGGPKFFVAVMERLKSTIAEVAEDHHFRIVPTLLDFNKRENQMGKRLLEVVQPGLESFYNKLRFDFDGNFIDVHNENIMVRENGSLVVSDPVSWYYKPMPEINRMKEKDFTLLASSTRH